MEPIIIAIDGPSGAGKGTIARAVATRLGFHHVDTGAMYRAVAWKACTTVSICPTKRRSRRSPSARDSTSATDGSAIDGHDIAGRSARRRSTRLRQRSPVSPRSGECSSSVNAQLAARGGTVMEGRDIGTVVFPAREVKIYLDASPEERARRRATDPAHASGKGSAAIQEVATALAERDRRDRTRDASPLAIAEDAVVIDTTELSIDAAVDRVMAVVEQTASSSSFSLHTVQRFDLVSLYPDNRPKTPDRVPSGACRARRSCRTP